LIESAKESERLSERKGERGRGGEGAIERGSEGAREGVRLRLRSFLVTFPIFVGPFNPPALLSPAPPQCSGRIRAGIPLSMLPILRLRLLFESLQACSFRVGAAGAAASVRGCGCLPVKPTQTPPLLAPPGSSTTCRQIRISRPADSP
jgi:hypothetical protein